MNAECCSIGLGEYDIDGSRGTYGVHAQLPSPLRKARHSRPNAGSDGLGCTTHRSRAINEPGNGSPHLWPDTYLHEHSERIGGRAQLAAAVVEHRARGAGGRIEHRFEMFDMGDDSPVIEFAAAERRQ